MKFSCIQYMVHGWLVNVLFNWKIIVYVILQQKDTISRAAFVLGVYKLFNQLTEWNYYGLILLGNQITCS